MDRLRSALALSCLMVVAGTGAARAQAAPVDSPPAAAPSSSAPDSPGGTPSAGSSTTVPSGGVDGDAPTVAGVPMVDARQQDNRSARYGIGLRGRWATIPKWLLGIFLTEKQSLSSYTVGLEGFRRSGSFDLVLGVAWQALSPPDGNWLGKTKNPARDTDYVQFRDFGSVSVDVAFLSRTELNPYVFLHYGGGVGIGIVTGKILGTSNGSPGCATAPGDPTKCYPVLTSGCPTGPCSETALSNSEGSPDSYERGSRHEEPDVPAVYPLVNLIVGLDFKIPNAGGLELKIDGGYFFPYFFLGAGTAYQF